MKLLTTREMCERLAKAICTDIVLYLGKDVCHYQRGLPMSKALAEAIGEGRELYLTRTVPQFAELFDEILIGFAKIDPDNASTQFRLAFEARSAANDGSSPDVSPPFSSTALMNDGRRDDGVRVAGGATVIWLLIIAVIVAGVVCCVIFC